ncbi:MAG: hypothetical protein SFU56_19425 [Capsulimonadales bacterium]|nr:hypothetical protein [Capsulimonadales bacterium]
MRTQNLPCKLTEDEVARAARESAQAVKERLNVEGEKKEANAEFKQRLEFYSNVVNKKSDMVRTGIEWRDVEVEYRFNYELGTVRVIRTDTGECIEDRPMSPNERQMKMRV